MWHMCCKHTGLMIHKRPTLAVSLSKIFVHFNGYCAQVRKVNLIKSTICHTTG